MARYENFVTRVDRHTEDFANLNELVFPVFRLEDMFPIYYWYHKRAFRI